jgi:hypothetical protein
MSSPAQTTVCDLYSCIHLLLPYLILLSLPCFVIRRNQVEVCKLLVIFPVQLK